MTSEETNDPASLSMEGLVARLGTATQGVPMTRAERREAIDDLKGDLEEVNSALEGLAEEVKDLRERIAEAKSRKARVKARLAELRAQK
jgi:chromosome segregation ATPase